MKNLFARAAAWEVPHLEMDAAKSCLAQCLEIAEKAGLSEGDYLTVANGLGDVFKKLGAPKPFPSVFRASEISARFWSDVGTFDVNVQGHKLTRTSSDTGPAQLRWVETTFSIVTDVSDSDAKIVTLKARDAGLKSFFSTYTTAYRITNVEIQTPIGKLKFELPETLKSIAKEEEAEADAESSERYDAVDATYFWSHTANTFVNILTEEAERHKTCD